MKRQDDETDRSYSVFSCEHGCWVIGRYAPTDDVSGLLYTWNRRGLRFLSLDVARKLGALVAVTESSGAADAWIAELEGVSNEG